MTTKRTSAKDKLEQNQQLVKQRLQDKAVPYELTEDGIRVNELAQVYETALGIYRHKPALRYLKGRVKAEDHNYGTWLRAVKFADELEVDFTTYITAQFYYMDRWFNRAPKVMEIASFKTKVNAKERVKLYLAEQGASKAVYGPSQEAAPPDQAANERRSETALKSLMRNYASSEEDIIKVFARPDVSDAYFDKKWLQRNDTYKKLVQQGEL